jgi:HSP20 family protein
MLSSFFDVGPHFNDTFRTFDLLSREVNRALQERAEPREARAARTREARDRTPAFDLYEKDDAYVFIAELPGVTTEELSITVEGDVVAISAKRELSAPEGYEPRVRERSAFSFDRSFRTSARLDADKAEARLENGVLTLTLPKAGEAKPHKIEIKHGG